MHGVSFLWKLLWLLLDVHSFRSSWLSPGLSLGVGPPLAGPLRVLRASALCWKPLCWSELFSYDEPWKHSITLVHSRYRMEMLTINLWIFLLSLCRPLQEHSPLGSASGSFFLLHLSRVRRISLPPPLEFPEESPAVLGKWQRASLWGIPS